RYLRFGLAGAEVQMVEIVRDGLVKRRQLGVDQQVVMAGVLAERAGRRDAHVAQAEIDLQLRRNGGSVLEIDEVDLCARRRRGGASASLTFSEGNAAGRDIEEQQRRDYSRAQPCSDRLEHVHGYFPHSFRRLMKCSVDPVHEPTI